jgi:hypothetical protein
VPELYASKTTEQFCSTFEHIDFKKREAGFLKSGLELV